MTDETTTPESAPASSPRRNFMRRRKVCPFSGAGAPKIDYKDVKLL
ncbi:MAG TPA: 30S ribosomal protein S18, partial [Caulobacteraceae bacterium]